MLGQCCSPLLVQCRSIVYDAGSTLFQYWVRCILFISFMFLRSGVLKCQPFPPHSTPLSPKSDTNSGKINLKGTWPGLIIIKKYIIINTFYYSCDSTSPWQKSKPTAQIAANSRFGNKMNRDVGHFCAHTN